MDSGRQGTFDSAVEIRLRTGIARKALQRWEKRLAGAIGTLPDPERETAQAERAELLARTLLAHLGAVAKGATTARLPDYGGDGTGFVEIEVDPARGARGTAEDMLRRARKQRRGAAMAPRRRGMLERELDEIGIWRGRLDAAAAGVEPEASGTEDASAAPGGGRKDARRAVRLLEGILDDLQARLLPRGLWPMPPRTREAPAPREPVRWALDDGWILMAGRSGTENDFLTTRIARPDDLWFHVANVPGAHVVLRSPDGRSAPPPPAHVEQAAAVAAWLSRLRAQERVEVRYTERRRVRKPRKAPAGTVVMEQSRSILVRPAPPPRPED